MRKRVTGKRRDPERKMRDLSTLRLERVNLQALMQKLEAAEQRNKTNRQAKQSTLSCGLSGQVRSTVNKINAKTAQLKHEVNTTSHSGLFHRGDHDPRICVCSSHH